MKTKTAPRVPATVAVSALRPAEIRYAFEVIVAETESITFGITVSRLTGKLDCRVSFHGENKNLEFLPAEVFAEVQEALQVVRGKVKLEDLAEVHE